MDAKKRTKNRAEVECKGNETHVHHGRDLVDVLIGCIVNLDDALTSQGVKSWNQGRKMVGHRRSSRSPPSKVNNTKMGTEIATKPAKYYLQPDKLGPDSVPKNSPKKNFVRRPWRNPSENKGKPWKERKAKAIPDNGAHSKPWKKRTAKDEFFKLPYEGM